MLLLRVRVFHNLRGKYFEKINDKLVDINEKFVIINDNIKEGNENVIKEIKEFIAESNKNK